MAFPATTVLKLTPESTQRVGYLITAELLTTSEVLISSDLAVLLLEPFVRLCQVQALSVKASTLTSTVGDLLQDAIIAYSKSFVSKK